MRMKPTTHTALITKPMNAAPKVVLIVSTVILNSKDERKRVDFFVSSVLA